MTKYTVHKYRYSDEPILMEKGAKILCAHMQNGHPCMWALVNAEETEKESRRFLLLPTGHITIQPEPQENLDYIGTCHSITAQSHYVWHIFEIVRSDNEVGRV